MQDTIRQNAQKQEETQQTTDAEKTGKAGKVKNWFRAHPPLAVVKKHKKLTALVLVVVIVVAAVGTHLSSKKKQMANMMSQQAISTTELKKQDLKNTIAVNGTIASDTSRSISANVSNVEITEVCVSVGDEVKAGDVLCVLDSSSLEKSKEIVEKEQSASKTKAGMNTASAARELANTVETSEDPEQPESGKMTRRRTATTAPWQKTMRRMKATSRRWQPGRPTSRRKVMPGAV